MAKMLELVSALPLTAETWSAPAIGRVGENTLVLGADRDGMLSAFEGSTGSLVWRKKLGSCISASPILADLQGYGVETILIGTHDGELHALRLADGSEVWRYKCANMIRATVAIADVNEDGLPEIVVASYGPEITVLTSTGELIWKRKRPKHVWVGGTKHGIVSAPLVCDVDRDGRPEIVLGGRSPWIICYDAATGRPKWYRKLRYDTDSCPSFALVDDTPLILFGGGEHTAGRGDNALIALDGRTGEERWRVNGGGGIDCSPMVERLPGGDTLAYCGTLASHKLFAVDVASGRQAWELAFGPTQDCDHSTRDAKQPADDSLCRLSPAEPYFTEYAVCRSYTNPLLADFDGDGRMEAAAGSNNGRLVIADARSGEVRQWVETGGMVRGSFGLADIDGDEKAELIVPSGDRLLVYKMAANPPPTRFFKGRADLLGAGFEAPPASPVLIGGLQFLGLRMWWDLTVKDFARFVFIKIDHYLLARFRPSPFDYYY